MTIEEIRKNAPYCATHYFNKFDKVSYYCFIENQMCVIRNGWELFPQYQDGLKPL